MADTGLREVPNPSETLLSGRPLNTPGTCVACVMEGSRPILAEIQALVAQQTSSDPVVREGAEIAVYNGTEGYGVAGAEREALEADGFWVSGVGDTATGGCTERYCLYVLNEEKTGTRAALEERYGVAGRPGTELPTDIWAGTADFVIVVGQEPAASDGAEVGE